MRKRGRERRVGGERREREKRERERKGWKEKIPGREVSLF